MDAFNLIIYYTLLIYKINKNLEGSQILHKNSAKLDTAISDLAFLFYYFIPKMVKSLRRTTHSYKTYD